MNWDQPERNFVIMGMGRSGTSLACKLISERVENAYCLNETEIVFDRVPAHLADARRRLAEGKPVPNRWSDSGLSSDTVRVKAPIRERRAEGEYDRNAVVGVKMVQEYRHALASGYLIVAMLRDPVFAIASWRQTDTVWNHVIDADMDVHWQARQIPFKRSTRLERQCELWDYYARQILETKEKGGVRVDVWRYEGLTSLPDFHLRDFAEYFGLRAVRGVRLTNMNDPSRFYGLKRIREAVAEICKSRGDFGYS